MEPEPYESSRSGGAAANFADPVPKGSRWRRTDLVAIALLVVVAAAIRFWNLGHPDAVVFDELNFGGEAGAYLRGEQFIDSHPPLAVELIALGMRIFGDSPAALRASNAILGTALVAITYLLALRMFGSRLAAWIAAALVLCDGEFIVDSRTAMQEMTYVTFAALSYLFFFRFVQSGTLGRRRRSLAMLGFSIGLCLAGKLYVPVAVPLLISGFLLYELMTRGSGCAPIAAGPSARVIVGAFVLVGSTAAIAWLMVFVPNFVFLRWGGMSSIWQYFRDAGWLQTGITSGERSFARDVRAAPWWTWPIVLHPIVYWQESFPDGLIATEWLAPNPIACWSGLAAIVVNAIRILKRPTLASAFVVIGYVAFLAIFLPISRTTYPYHYMPALYLSYLALGCELARCWNGDAARWERVVILAALAPAIFIAVDSTPLMLSASAVLASTLVAAIAMRNGGRVASAASIAAMAAAFLYFLPLWMAVPVSREAYDARMWLKGPGVANWTTYERYQQ